MRRSLLATFAILMLAPLASRAEHADIVLKMFRLDSVTGMTADEVTASSDQEPPPGGVKQRPMIKAKARDPLILQFILINTYPHGVNKDVTVRYFVIPVPKFNHKALPSLDDCVVRGQFQMHFKPKCRVGARVALNIPNPGIYMLRVDTLNTASDHEHFAAIDVQVE